MTRRTIGIVGTFDVENYGDLLFPLLAERELRARLGDLELRRYSYRRKDPADWPYAVRNTEDLLADLDDLDGLVLGGGHLVRFDTQVAPGYQPPAPDLHHPTSIWLTPVLAAAAAGVPVAWNAVGASANTPAWAQPWLRSAIAASAYVAVRDVPSAAELAEVAPDADVVVVPDSAFGLAPALPDLAPAHAVDALLAALGVDGPFVIVQAARRLRGAHDQLQASLPRLAADGLHLLELSVSPILGDRVGQLGIDAPLVPVEPWPAPAVLAGLVARAAGVIAHSLHLSITALTAGVPVHRLPAPSGTKYQLLERYAGVRQFSSSGQELAAHVREALAVEPANDPMLEEARTELTRHWDRIADALEPSAARTVQVLAARRLLLTVPGALSEGLSEHRRLTDQRDAVTAARETIARELAYERDWAAELAAQSRAVGELLADHQRELGRVRRRLAAATAELEQQRAEATVDRALRSAGRTARSALQTARERGPAQLLARARDRARSGGGPAPSTRQASLEEQRALGRRLAAALPATGTRRGPLVSVVMLNRSGAHHLRRCLPALAATAYRDIELIVVDNGSDDESVAVLEAWGPPFPLRVLRNSQNRSFSAATNQGAAAASGDLLLLLNNDVEPLTPDWLGRMVETLRVRDASAVGARLVYPSGRRHPEVGAGLDDLTLQHRGVGFRLFDGMPRAVNLGAGEDPSGPAAAAVREVQAVTAACLLVRRDAYETVDGLDEAYDYGTEDVDLCMKLRRNGGRIVYDGGAVLWHHEFGTQGETARKARRERRNRNYDRFLDRWGPQIYREVLLDRLSGAGRWCEDPLHVALTVTRDDPEAGWGDWFTAHELGAELERLGWRVSYIERHKDRWYRLPRDIDVLLVLLDAYDLRRAPAHVVTVAWVRNWTDRWVERPWFDDYDLVLASSARSREVIERRSAKAAHLLPLATNPARFRPVPGAQVDTDVLFAGSYWNRPRGVAEALPLLPPAVRVRVHGKGWDKVPALAGVHRGFLHYDKLPGAYAAARLVLDDTAEHGKPYAAVNSRVFDAIAAGALVLSDNVEGVRELFDDDFPVYQHAAELPQRVAALLADPVGAKTLAARYRAQVLERHTYAARARRLRDLLTDWARAEKVDLAVAALDGEEAARFDEHHLARGLQRALEHRGRPARVRLRSVWERPVAARADVVVAVGGRRVPPTRQSQVHVLWAVNHPELLTRDRCAMHDLVLVASEQVAQRLQRDGVAPRAAVLHRACDPERPMAPTVADHAVLRFVGDAGDGTGRVLHDLLPTEHDLAVHGRGWGAGLLDPRHLRGPSPVLATVRSLAAASDIMLIGNPGRGFLSTVLYEALAAGAVVVSDAPDDVLPVFGAAVHTYRSRMELKALVAHLLGASDAGATRVAPEHTFAARAQDLLARLAPLTADRETTVVPDLRVDLPPERAALA